MLTKAESGTIFSTRVETAALVDPAPRPVLVIHGRGQTFVPPEQEMEVYRRLSWPRQEFWPSDNYQKSRAAIKAVRSDTELIKSLFRQWMGLSDPTTSDPGVRARMLEFIEEARPEPVI